MVKVKMTADARGASDGFTILDYRKGEVYEVSEPLAFCFLHEEVAVEVTETTPVETVTEKVTKSKKKPVLPQVQ